jgi:hypothetical protein
MDRIWAEGGGWTNALMVLTFIYTFFQKIFTGLGEIVLPSNNNVDKKIPYTTRRNKINRSHPSTILIHENVYSPVQ